MNEIETCFAPNESSLDFFYKVSQKTNDIPKEADDNILLQQESSTTLYFLQSTRLLEYKARDFRVDLTHLNLPPDFIASNNMFQIPAETFNAPMFGRPGFPTTSNRTIFEFQKINKAFRSAVFQINNLLTSCQQNYKLSSTANLDAIVEELHKQFIVVTTLGEFQCNLLNLNTSLKEGRCAFELTRMQLGTMQWRISHALMQFELENRNSQVELSDIKKDVTNNVYPEIGSTCANTPEFFQESLENVSITIQNYKLDKNKIDQIVSVTAQSPAIKTHIKTIAESVQNVLHKESAELTPIFSFP